MFWVEIHVVLVRVSEIDLGVVLGSKLTWICVRAKNGLVLVWASNFTRFLCGWLK